MQMKLKTIENESTPELPQIYYECQNVFGDAL